MLDVLVEHGAKLPESGVFLDLGGGRGYAAIAAATRVRQSIICDIDTAPAREVISSLGYKNVSTIQSLAGVESLANVLFMWHSLEHLPDPSEFWRDNRRALADNCEILLQVPMYMPEYVVDAHFIFFNETSLNAWAKELGATIRKTLIDHENNFITAIGNLLPGGCGCRLKPGLSAPAELAAQHHGDGHSRQQPRQDQRLPDQPPPAPSLDSTGSSGPHGAGATTELDFTVPRSNSTTMKLFTAIYNDARLLGHFLAHYRRAGVTEFFIAVDPSFRSAAAEFSSTYNLTLFDELDVADSFTGGVTAVTEMRQRHQGMSEWVIIVDLDEFIEFPGNIRDIIQPAEQEQANVIRATMWDRFTRDGHITEFSSERDLRQIYPVRARFIKDVMEGADYKGVLVKGLIKSVAAHHVFEGEVLCSRMLDLSHYKWFDGAIDRVKAARQMLTEAGRPWAAEFQRALDHYERNGRFAWEQFGGELDPLLDGRAAEDGREQEQGTKDPLRAIVDVSATIPGWTRGEDAEEVARASLSLGDNPVIVEIGAFLGCCTVLLAGPRRLRGTGIVHCVDPFDCSGDAFSVPYYRDIVGSLGGGRLREHFEANISQAGLSDWVQVHEGRATDIAASWTQPIDLLLLDADQSPEGVRAAYESWEPFLKPGGLIVLRNTQPREYAEGHDGHRRLALEEIVPAKYDDIRQAADTTIARKRHQLDGADTGGARVRSHRRNNATEVHLYAQCWNDELMLPFFFRHYDSFVDRYIIFDDGSTDRSVDILADHPKVELRPFVRSDPDSFVLSEQALSNQCWKESRDEADWVIVTDVDEHLVHPAMRDYLDACAHAGVTLVPALGFQMIGEEVPCDGQVLRDAVPFGAPWDQMMKPSIFRPSEIEEMNFGTGRHRAQPVGEVRVPERDEVLLLHYKYLGLVRAHARHRELLARLGAKDLDNRWGHQYAWSQEQLAEDWDTFASWAVDVRKISLKAYPLPRWWLPRITVPVNHCVNIVEVELTPLGHLVGDDIDIGDRRGAAGDRGDPDVDPHGRAEG